MKTDNHTKLALLAAVLVGLFAIVAVNKYISGKTEVKEELKATILVANVEIAEGGEIGDEMLGVAEIPFAALSNIHISMPPQGDAAFGKAYADAKAKIVGRRVKRIVAANTPIFWIDVDTEPKTPFADLIAEGNRAVTLPVDSVSSVCGFIKPGSRVDVALTTTAEKLGLVAKTPALETRGAKEEVVTSIILQNVPVIATDRSYDLQSDTERYSTITLNLPVRAALMMVQARSMGQITYLLRNVRDTKTEGDRSRVTVAPGQSFNEAVRSN